MAGNTKQAQKKGRKSSPPPASNDVVLDQNEIMRAMLAMQKGKQREDSGSDGESGEGSEEEESGEESASEAESSTAAQQNLKRRRSTSLSLGSESEPEAAPARKETRGRVGVSRTAISTKAPTNTQPKPTGLQSAPRPAAGTTFEDLGLSQPIIRALASISITKPTEIQSACIGPIMAGRDCIGGAKTGSGKTMAFALPILERIARDPFGVWAVVLTPTRELAYQLTEQFLAIGKPLGLTTSTIVGGMDSMKQAKELEGRPHIIVATPGRLCDLLRSGGVGPGKLSRVKVLVLDEADRMLTPTFAPDLAYLFSQVPAKRQTCLFTATVSEAIMDLANKPPPAGKEAPHVYRVASDTLTVANLKQKYLFIPSQIRDPYLLYILQNPLEDIDVALRIDPKKAKAQEREATMGNKRGKKSRSEPEPTEESPSVPSTVIFTQRCATAHLLHLLLNSLDIPSVPLHSHLTQPQRLLSLARFRAHEVPVLVTTDVGSRGLDIPEVAMVINWDCPRRADDYVHRVGRTARAGRGGVAVTIVTERDVELVKVIEDEVNVKLEELKLNEDTVLEGLNKVSMARRLATMEMHDSGFGERQALNKAKQIKRQKRDATK